MLRRRNLRRWPLLVAAVIGLFGLLLTVGGFPGDSAAAAAQPLPADLAPVMRDLEPMSHPVTALEAWQQESAPGVGAATVFGDDDRLPVLDTTQPGWRTIVLLLIYNQYGELDGACSGSMLNYNVVLTAAHCLYSSGNYVGSVLVAPGASPYSAPFGVASAVRMAVAKGWAEGNGLLSGIGPVPPSPYDFGLVFLDDAPFGNQIAPYLTVANVPDSYFARADVEIATAGYPGDKVTGSMWTASSFEYAFDGDYLYTALDIYEGQSGSPIYTLTTTDGGGYVFSVVSGGNARYNRSVRFTEPVIQALNRYCESEGCTIHSALLSDSYSLDAWRFCTSSWSCSSGPEPLRIGSRVYVNFTLAPGPAAAVHVEAYFNGVSYQSIDWGSPPYPADSVFYVQEPGLGAPTSAGTLELRVWVGKSYAGSISAEVSANNTPTPTATRTPTPTPTRRPANPTNTPSSTSPRPTVGFRVIAAGIGRD